MNIYSCDHGDFIVAYGGRNCPVCDLQKELEDKEEELTTLQDAFDDLNNEYIDFRHNYDFQVQVANKVTEHESNM